MSSLHKIIFAGHRARQRSVRPARDLASVPALDVDGLGKVFQDRRRGSMEAVKDVTFTCRHGEVFGLLGPNGAGKTTTLRMLSTILRPSSGSARVAGHDVVDAPLDVRRNIGFLSGNTGLYDRLSARETLEYFGRLHQIPEEGLRERVNAILEIFEMRSFADVRCEKLSTGMKQKVSIARTIVHDPPILILDEPTLGLDILVAATMIKFIEDCRDRGKCIIFSTHIMSEVQRLCDRIGIIHGGRLRAIGTLDELRDETGREFLEDIFMDILARTTTKALR